MVQRKARIVKAISEYIKKSGKRAPRKESQFLNTPTSPQIIQNVNVKLFLNETGTSLKVALIANLLAIKTFLRFLIEGTPCSASGNFY